MSSDVPEQFRPRLCHVVKWADFAGYGFNLHAEKGKAGQFIGQVDDGSPAQAAGLREGDRIVEVNGVNIGNENHQQVVTRIKSGGDETRLLVVDTNTDNWYKEQKRVVRGELPEVWFQSASRDQAPEPQPEEPAAPEPDVEAFQQSVAVADAAVEEPEAVQEQRHMEEVVAAVATNGDADTSQDMLHRPRLCHIKMWPHFQGYGFNLHAERDKPGQYIGLVDDNSPALSAGLRVNDRIVEVNGKNVEGMAHPEVISLIKAVPNETRLLVVDRTVDAYYKDRGVTVNSGMPQVDSIVCPGGDEPNGGAVENGIVAPVVVPVPDVEEAATPAEAEAVAVVEEASVEAQQQEVENTVPAEVSAVQEEVEAVPAEVVAVQEEVAVAQEVPKVEVAPAPEEPVVQQAEVVEQAVVKQEEAVEAAQVPEEIVAPEPVNGVNSAPAPEPEPVPVPEPEPEFAVAPAPVSTPAPAPTPAPASDNLDGLELNLSVAEMKERLKARKKQDPRTSKLTFEQKYKDFQRM